MASAGSQPKMRNELLTFVDASDGLFESLALNASLTDCELRLLHSYVFRHHRAMLRLLNRKRLELTSGLRLSKANMLRAPMMTK